MEINTARFVISNTQISKCPKPDKAEYAFIGRSNVGKSSLINMLTNNKKLAKISQQPGKTQLINHFIINDDWYLVDLPGYGYAKASKTSREKWEKFIWNYVLKRENLYCLFVLLDARHDPQKIDLEFMQKLGLNGIPFSIVFTKIDKLTKGVLAQNIKNYLKTLKKDWEEVPPHFITSAVNKNGKEEILSFIGEINSKDSH